MLDLGCGTGSFGRLKPDPAITVHGVDRDPSAVTVAALWEEAVVADIATDPLPYRDASFDAAFAKDVLEHLPDPLAALGEVFRVLRPGGTLVVSVPMEFPWVVWDDYTHVRGFTRSALRTLVGDAGFEPLRLDPMGAVPLAGRLRLVGAIPILLRLPGMRRLFGRSWELVATRR